MHTRLVVHHLFSLLIVASLLLTPAAPTAQATVPQAVSLRTEQAATPQTDSLRYDIGLFRTHIVIDSPARRQRLDKVGVTVLEEGDGWAVVLVDDEQLETLARLRYEPQASDEFTTLVEANTDANSWLAAGLAPLVTQAVSLRSLDPHPASPTVGEERMSARKTLRAAARALTPEQRTVLADLTSLDDDADGLTNAQEAWWCTDPLNADTDGWGRGALPRVTDDAGYIFAEMPTWVKAPGNHPFVAAFPVPEIDVVASSLKVETVTTDYVSSSGTEKSYSTAKTEGTSTSVADSVTWNDWQETSITQPISALGARGAIDPTLPSVCTPHLAALPYIGPYAVAGCKVTEVLTHLLSHN